MTTIEQEYILRLLGDFNCLRVSHMERLVRAKYGKNAKAVAAMLRQLRVMGKVRLDGETVSLVYSTAHDDVLTAFDVMLDMTRGAVESVEPAAPPFTLIFTTAADTAGIIAAGEGRGGKIPKNEAMTIVIVLNNMEQRQYFADGKNRYFALRDENGRYKYFSNGQGG